MIRLLLDSHALIWAFSDSNRLSLPARSAIESATEIYVSAASVWELTTKYRIGKLPSVANFIPDMEKNLRDLGLRDLPVSIQHAKTAGLLPGTHKDPFDRMLIAQALLEKLSLVSNEALFDDYGVKRIW